MKHQTRYLMVMVTAPDLKTARRLAQAALDARAAACANLIFPVESHYWWQGRQERSTEILLVFKTRQIRLAALQRCIMKIHPYDTPEFIAAPISSGAKKYLTWITESTVNQRKPKRPGTKLPGRRHSNQER